MTRVQPCEGDRWRVATKYKPTGVETVKTYDAVMICSGRYNKPLMPKIAGQEHFEGAILHSQAYRSSEKFRGKRVLIVGAGPSALDMAALISATAQHVTPIYF